MNNTRGLYRGKHADKWVEGNYLHLNDGLEYEIDIIVDAAGQYKRIDDPETIGECAGCLDVQGRLIFEGDIICEGNSNEPLIVKYDEQLGRFVCYDEKADVTWTFFDLNLELVEIIGNVHEEQMKL